MLESVYQGRLIKKLRRLFPGIVIQKNDSSYTQGIPDLSLFYRSKWAMLEVKAHKDAESQPNQEFYINKLNHMSFAAVIYPENEAEVLDGLQQTFRPGRKTRTAKP